jgi:hypothetical protein
MAGAPAGAAGKATVNVVHGIPGVPVKVCVDGAAVADDFRYGHKIFGARLPAGEHKVKLVAAGHACGASAILRHRYDLQAGTNVTIVAALDADGDPRLKVWPNKVKQTDAGMARISVRHAAQAPAVNVWANGSPLIGGRHFDWGSGATAMVPEDEYTVKVTLPGSKKAVIGPATLNLRGGFAYQVYAVGQADSYRLVVVKVNVGTSG